MKSTMIKTKFSNHAIAMAAIELDVPIMDFKDVKYDEKTKQWRVTFE